MSPQVAAPLIFGLMVVMAIVVRAVHRRSEQARVQEEERLTAALGHQMMALQANAALKATAQAQLPEQASFAQPQLGAQAASMPQLGAPQAGRPPLRRPPSNPSADAESMLRAIAGAPSLHGPHVPPLTGQKLDKLARGWAGALDPERLEGGSLKHEAVQPKPAPLPIAAAGPLAGADVAGALPMHVGVVSQNVSERTALPGSARVAVLWLRSVGDHAVWCERRMPAEGGGVVREILLVLRISRKGEVEQKWSFG